MNQMEYSNLSLLRLAKGVKFARWRRFRGIDRAMKTRCGNSRCRLLFIPRQHVFQSREEPVDLLAVVIEMARDTDIAIAAEIDDRHFDAELVPDDVLERIGDGGGLFVVVGARGTWAMLPYQAG